MGTKWDPGKHRYCKYWPCPNSSLVETVKLRQKIKNNKISFWYVLNFCVQTHCRRAGAI